MGESLAHAVSEADGGYRDRISGPPEGSGKPAITGVEVESSVPSGQALGAYSVPGSPVRMDWRTETLWSMEVMPGCPFGMVSIEVEVPYRGDEQQVWRGNRYYPAFVRVDPEAGVPAHLAHRLAEAVLIAQAGADAFDNLDTAYCGHWSPCDCGAAR